MGFVFALFGLIFWAIPTLIKQSGRQAPPITDWDRYYQDRASISDEQFKKNLYSGVYTKDDNS